MTDLIGIVDQFGTGGIDAAGQIADSSVGTFVIYGLGISVMVTLLGILFYAIGVARGRK